MKKAKRCKYRSLLNRVRTIVNTATMLSTVAFVIAILVVLRQGMLMLEESASEYYIDAIEEAISNDIKYNEFNDTDGIEREVSRIHSSAPFFTMLVTIDDDMVYCKYGYEFLDEFFDINSDDNIAIKRHEIELDRIPKYSRELVNGDGVVYGYIDLGFDTAFKRTIYFVAIVTTVLIGIAIMLIMRIFTKKLTKPILEPLNKLQQELEELADKEFDTTLAPTLTIDNRTVNEVYDLSIATNKLLERMVNYNEMITQSEKMASVGQLTAAITHEINTPLGAINANVNMIKLIAEAITDDMFKEDVEEVIELKNQIHEGAKLSEEACERIDKIVRSLRLYSRIDQADFMPGSINDSLSSVIILTTNLHKNRIVIHEDFGDIPEVACHIGLINQVFMNLIINAVQAIEGKGKITLTTSADDENVYISIEDTGCGISPKNIYNIFQFGFTTKQPGSGSGIGLALSNNIIKKHNGNIEVESVEGEGSTFKVALPIKQEPELMEEMKGDLND